MGLIRWVQQKYYGYKYHDEIEFLKEYYKNPYYFEGKRFIWGMQSGDSLSNGPPNLNTMNDIDIVYDDESKKYYLSIETIYQFDKGVEGEREYLKYLLNGFTDWMNEQDYSVRLSPSLFIPIDFSWSGKSYYIEKDSVEELYAEFKWSVENYGLDGEKILV